MDEQDRILIENNFSTIELNEKQLEYYDQSLLKANNELRFQITNITIKIYKPYTNSRTIVLYFSYVRNFQLHFFIHI